ncbi:MAG TPA: response regulator [Planctomycetota bacterium]
MDSLPVKPRILIVDDHPANLLAFEVVLEREFSPYLAESGRQALEVSERADFAAILLDVRMPGLDGYETAVELRRREKTRFTPVIFTSAAVETPPSVLRGMSAGVMDFVFTPVDPDFLRFKVAAHVRSYLDTRSIHFQIERVAHRMRSLRSQIARKTPLDDALDEQIRQLEGMSEDLKRRSGGLARVVT